MDTEMEEESPYNVENFLQKSQIMKKNEIMSPKMPNKGNKIENKIPLDNKNGKIFNQNKVTEQLKESDIKQNLKEQIKEKEREIFLVLKNKTAQSNQNFINGDTALTERDHQLPKVDSNSQFLNQQKNIEVTIPMQIKNEKQNLMCTEDRILQELEEDFQQIEHSNKIENSKSSLESSNSQISQPQFHKNYSGISSPSDYSVCQLGPQKYFKQENPVSKNSFEEALQKEKIKSSIINIQKLKQDQQDNKHQKQIQKNNSMDQLHQKQNKTQNTNQARQSQSRQTQLSLANPAQKHKDARLNCIKPLQSIKPISVLPVQPKQNRIVPENEISNNMIRNEQNINKKQLHTNLQVQKLFQDFNSKTEQINKKKELKQSSKTKLSLTKR